MRADETPWRRFGGEHYRRYRGERISVCDGATLGTYVAYCGPNAVTTTYTVRSAKRAAERAAVKLAVARQHAQSARVENLQQGAALVLAAVRGR